MPSVTKSRAFCLGPPSHPQWAVQLFMWDGTVCWNLLCLFRGGRGGPSPKVRAFCNSGWPDSGKFCGSIACPYSTSLRQVGSSCGTIEYNSLHGEKPEAVAYMGNNLQRTLLGQLVMCPSAAEPRLCEFRTCGGLNSASTEFATKTIPQGAPLPTEHSKSYDSVWGWL